MPNWLEVCGSEDIDQEDVMRFDHDTRIFAVYRSPDGQFHATDGLCTHEKIHLADGLVMDNTMRRKNGGEGGIITIPPRR